MPAGDGGRHGSTRRQGRDHHRWCSRDGCGGRQALVAEGAKVVIGDVLDVEGAAAAAELGDAAIFVHLDVTSEESWAAAVEAAHAAFGPVTVLVNNAGVLSYGPVDTIAKAEFERVAAVNMTGPMLGMKAVVPDMKAAGGGAIVNISSAAGLIPMANLGSYVASKWALRGLTKVAAMDLGHSGIRVNSIHPGGGRGRSGDVRRLRDPPHRQRQGDRCGGGLPGQRRGLLHHRCGARGRRRHGAGLDGGRGLNRSPGSTGGDLRAGGGPRPLPGVFGFRSPAEARVPLHALPR